MNAKTIPTAVPPSAVPAAGGRQVFVGGEALLLPLATWLMTTSAAPWAQMWLLAMALYFACKWITWRQAKSRAPAWIQLAYLLAWPGMDVDAFLGERGRRQAPPSIYEVLFAAAKLALGIAILYGAPRWLTLAPPYLAGWIGMVGLVFVLHFGCFHLLSCWWRALGIDAAPLMQWPMAATSLSEFWGRRWNTAFRDLTHRLLFRPLTPPLGLPSALVAGFVFSGIVHELVTSLPARGGYGGPTLYFSIQAIGLLAERSLRKHGEGSRAKWLERIYTAVVLLLPAPLLFHPPFVLRVVAPFLQAIGAQP